MTEKRCPQCKKSLPANLDYWYRRNRRGRQELSSWCKKCDANRSRDEYKRVKERKNYIKRCRKCRKVSPPRYKSLCDPCRKANKLKRLRKQAATRYNRLKAATPPWADIEVIEKFYVKCPEGYHVDHIIPLNHPLVCGLHVRSNLQYLPAEVNIKKSNRFDNGADISQCIS